MTSKISNLAKIILITLLPTALIWLPFFLRIQKIWGLPLPQEGMATIVANYDGPLFLVTAKTFYNPDTLSSFEFGLPSTYYAAHFPLFPILIKTFAGIFGFPYSMLFVTLVSSILAVYFFYLFIQGFVDKKDIFWITSVFALFPARWLIVRSVGSSEPLFVAAIIASIYFFRQKKYLLAGIWGAIAQLTKSPGILLFLAYLFIILIPKFNDLATGSFKKITTQVKLIRFSPILLIPIALLGVFILYKIKLNDFLAYFHSGDNIHLFFPPFQIFNFSQPWVGTFWLEEVIFVYLFALLGLVRLIKMKEYELSWFVAIFIASIFFVSHRDLVRYSLPIVPFLLAAFSETIVKKEFKIVMLVLFIPIYLFSLAYISQNVMPISDWSPLL